MIYFYSANTRINLNLSRVFLICLCKSKITQIHYYHNDIAVPARFCYLLGGGRSSLGGPVFDDLRALVEFAQAASIADSADRLHRTPSAMRRSLPIRRIAERADLAGGQIRRLAYKQTPGRTFADYELAVEAGRGPPSAHSNLIPVRLYRIDRSLNTYNNFILK